jgi:hypothetical protein
MKKEENPTILEFICQIIAVYLVFCFLFWTFNPKVMFEKIDQSFFGKQLTTEERLIEEKKDILSTNEIIKKTMEKRRAKKIQAEKICGKVYEDARGEFHCDI